MESCVVVQCSGQAYVEVVLVVGVSWVGEGVGIGVYGLHTIVRGVLDQAAERWIRLNLAEEAGSPPSLSDMNHIKFFLFSCHSICVQIALLPTAAAQHPLEKPISQLSPARDHVLYVFGRRSERIQCVDNFGVGREVVPQREHQIGPQVPDKREPAYLKQQNRQGHLCIDNGPSLIAAQREFERVVHDLVADQSGASVVQEGEVREQIVVGSVVGALEDAGVLGVVHRGLTEVELVALEVEGDG